MDLAAANQRDDFDLIAVLESTIQMLFTWNQFHVSFYSAIAVVDFQIQQQIADRPVLVDRTILSIEFNSDHAGILASGRQF